MFLGSLVSSSNEWGSEYYWIPINGAADALGMTSEYMQQVFKDLLHVKTFNEETNNWGALTNNGGAVPAPGFYFCGGVRFEGEEEESSHELTPEEFKDGSEHDVKLQRDGLNLILFVDD